MGGMADDNGQMDVGYPTPKKASRHQSFKDKRFSASGGVFEEDTKRGEEYTEDEL
jgi:hypothetical protein